MKAYLSSFLFLLVSLSLNRVISEIEHASVPPRGWNSYDSFCWTISEEEFLESAEIISQHLRPHGYKYVVVDYLWYRRKVPGAYVESLGFDVIDEWGRVIPDPDRWPSSRGGKGFTEVAKKVHGMGLKFGIHVMRGISRQAYDANTLILDPSKGVAYTESDRKWRAQDIGIKERACAWMPHGFMSANTKLEAGRAFLRSLYQQYAEWGVDFVKHDCVFGDDLDIDEITYVSEVLRKLDRPIIYSLSPGTSVTPAMAKEVNELVNMYRITGDDWDTWGDVAVHFDVTRDMANSKMIGAKGLKGKSWPDLDMLPLGWLTDPGSNQGPHRTCNLNLDEQRTQMTLWAMAKSPLMFGGDVRKLDNITYSIITNPTLLDINSFSTNNMEFPYAFERKANTLRDLTRRFKFGKHEHVLGLVSCKDQKANGWSVTSFVEDLEQICWKDSLKSLEPACLYKGKPLFASFDEQIGYEQEKHHLYPSNEMGICLDASPSWKRTAKDLKSISFSPCRRNANQLWKLNGSGTLVSNYSGLCAVMDSAAAKVGPTGIRSWIATGRQGEIYLAFFNLNQERTVIYAKISDIAKALPGENLDKKTCKYKEVWSEKDFGVAKGSISSSVEVHGSALFVLNCQ